jgi:hypothetical protein
MEVKLDMWLYIMKHWDGKEGMFAVHTFPRENSEAALERCTSLVHPYLVTIYDIFQIESAEENLFIMSEEL